MRNVIQATLVSEKISSNSKEAFELFEAQRFGEKTGEKIFYTLQETLYLVHAKKMEVLDSKDKQIVERELLKKFEKLDKKFKVKYFAFKDLRDKGYVVKTALKFGAEFRVYEPGKNIGEEHAKWILFPVSENQQLTWQDFSAKNRIAHSTKKNLLIGIVDEENQVSYYEVNWLNIK
ncbi:tRNA-splicing endonuclease [uncultured archaeon]|nr:tRNA-splicing endonuclease [uncultured archaeon]